MVRLVIWDAIAPIMTSLGCFSEILTVLSYVKFNGRNIDLKQETWTCNFLEYFRESIFVRETCFHIYNTSLCIHSNVPFFNW